MTEFYRTASQEDIERREQEAYDNQEAWIRKHCGKQAADKANYGWGVDEVEGVICTKVYGFGVLITDVESGEIDDSEITIPEEE